MPKSCYITVSNAALCQRCPALLAYMIHKGEKDAWRVGIKGKGYYYGTLFHRNIAQVFFEAASDKSDILHREIARSIPGGQKEIESLIRGKILFPFLEAHSEECTSGQIIALSKGVNVFSRALSDFLALIPSLARNPEENMSSVFIPPEQTLKACHECPEGKLIVSGRYDALLFNPDRCEARLFEFKGYMKSDVTVPLSQSLIYSWLVWRYTGIFPSVEIIYLDDADREPEMFTPSSVSEMVFAGLPGLFRAAFGVISLKRLPEIVRDKNLCVQCPFNDKCANDWRNLRVRKRQGASLLNVIVFMMFALMITAQVFFLAKWSADSSAEGREIMMYRINLDSLVEEGKKALRETDGNKKIVHSEKLDKEDSQLDFSGFYEGTKAEHNDEKDWELADIKINYGISYDLTIHDLEYSFDATFNNYNSSAKWVKQSGKNSNKKVFAAMLPIGTLKRNASNDIVLDGVGKPTYETVYNRFYLIRASVQLPENYYGRKLMYQVLVSRDENASSTSTFHNVDVLSFQEVWY